MAFIVEDGSGVPGANSYATVQYATSYFGERGRAAEFAGTEDEQKGWLVQATDYVERWRERFKSTPLLASQSLSFPRALLVGVAGTSRNMVVDAWMPETLLKATCEYAARAKRGPLAPDPIVDASGHTVVMTTREGGPINRAVAVAPGSRVQAVRSYPAGDAFLATLLRPADRRVIR
jgi:hypothetical protein